MHGRVSGAPFVKLAIGLFHRVQAGRHVEHLLDMFVGEENHWAPLLNTNYHWHLTVGFRD